MQALSACWHDIKEILRPCLLKWHPSFSTAYSSSGSWVEEFLFSITWRRCRHTSNPTIILFVSTVNKWSIWENVRRVTLIASNKNKRIHRSSQSSHGFSSVFILRFFQPSADERRGPRPHSMVRSFTMPSSQRPLSVASVTSISSDNSPSRPGSDG